MCGVYTSLYIRHVYTNNMENSISRILENKRKEIEQRKQKEKLPCLCCGGEIIHDDELCSKCETIYRSVMKK
jgi:hypothetical protein